MTAKYPNLHNFFYLAGSGLATQLLSTVYRIWLAQRIGATGLGIFSMTYPVYRLLSSIAALGLPFALTKWTAEYLTVGEFHEIGLLKKWAVRVVSFLSLGVAATLYLSASFLSCHLFSDPRVKEALVIIAPAIPFSALSAIYRGYYQGFSRMAPTAVSEVAEQIAETGVTAFGLTCLIAVLPLASYSYPVIGLTIGEIVCLTTLLSFRESSPPACLSPSATTGPPPYLEILHYSRPLLLNQIIVAISNAGEGVLIPQLLIRAGQTTAASTQWLGYLNGMAAPLAYFPLILLFPLGMVLSPQISSGFKENSLALLRAKVRRFYGATALIAIVCFQIIFLAAPWLAQTLYHNSLPVALIKILVIGMPFTAVSIINFTILAAIGASDKVLTISLWAIGLKTALIFLAASHGIAGAAWAIAITQVFSALSGALELRPFFIKLDA
jgi:stage V sporulation protein B